MPYFLGLTIEETAQVMGVKADTVKREWRTGKVWLKRELTVGERHAAAGHS
ncbi:MAG TPA: ECF-type sigma factor [Blastocatellia bacterium]|nr:ECF-type sigma factor [Blastocatellia bacterium]HMV87885.1 ECF-type sigma factor [Blastocatellia bacterium]HMY75166.1 ECF-type sigma factor [Blastocatellia bacterium]HMZ20174.1 ECF-type sigma factor [Blastocatellia bacterium]HNG34462.1 ECF-type sigma factor [Blastocatellia bacterium]